MQTSGRPSIVALVFALVASCAASQSALPPLPQLHLDLLPPATRDALARVYHDATARSTDAGSVGALGRMLQAWEAWDESHAVYLRAQALSPRAFDWLYLDGVVLQRLGRHAEAAIRYKQAAGVSPDYLPARVKLAQALLEAGEPEESRRLFEALIGQRAAEPFAHLGIGRIAATAGDQTTAVLHLERAVGLVPEWGAAQYALALSYRALGRMADAQHALDQYTQYGPRSPSLDDPVLVSVTALRDDAVANLERGLKLAEAGDLNGAIAAHEAALVRDPSFAQAHANLISLYGRLQNWKKAEEHYHAVVALGVNLADAHYDYGVVLGLQGKWELAAEAYRQATLVNPRHALAYNNLAQILERQQQLEAALDAYRQAIDGQPTLRVARFNEGRILLALGRPREAIAELQKLVEPIDAEAPRYLYALATAYGRVADRENALKWATEARRLAVQYGQNDLAAAIDRDLAVIK
jgi:tetratricopeptide (TPR) repeat protein